MASSLESLLWANERDCKVILPAASPPRFYEPEFEEWHRLVFDMNLRGKMIFFDKIKSMTLTRESLKILTNNNISRSLIFGRCDVFEFDKLNVVDFDFIENKERYVVRDWLQANSVNMPLKGLKLSRPEGFLRSVLFYENLKGVAQSYLDAEQTRDVEYSDIYVRFLVRQALRDKGYTGRKNGFDAKGNQKFLSLDLVVTKREVERQFCEVYKSTERVIFHDTSW